MTTSSPGRRRLDATAAYDMPIREPRFRSPVTQRIVVSAWFLAWIVGTALAASAVIDVGAPDWLGRPGAALLCVVFVVGLVHRSGAHMRIWSVLAVLLAAAALITQTQALITSATLVTAVTGSMLAAMLTEPAKSAGHVLREFCFAFIMGLTVMISVGAWNAQVQYKFFGLTVIAIALALSIVLIWNLGANLHGLSKRELGVLIGIAIAIALLIAYGSLLRTYASEGVLEFFNQATVWMRSTIGGVPRPSEVFIGFPCLVVGAALRSKRREGWWITAFGVIGTGTMASALVSPNAYPSYIGLSTLYSAVLGVVIGLIVRSFTVRDGGSRASRAFETMSRHEPKRTEPLK